VADRPTVAAIVLNWRQPEKSLAVVPDLLRDPAVRVFLRDNGSGDGVSPAALRRGVDAMIADGVSADRIHLEVGETNLGFAGGVNRGLQWAEAQGLPLVLLANNDVRVPEGVVATLAELLTADVEVAAVAPTILYPDGRVWAEGGELRAGANLVRLCRQGRAATPADHCPREVDFVPGAFAMFRTAQLVELGGLEESYFMYWEDVDLCRRLAPRGRVVWVPWVSVVHESGGSSGGRRSPMRKFMQAANSVHYLRRHGSVGQWLALLFWDVLLGPLALAGGLRQGWGKMRGVWFGLCGGRVDERHVAWIRAEGGG